MKGCYRKEMKKILISSVIGLTTGIGILEWFHLETKRLTIKNYQIASEKIPEAFCGTKLAVMTDLHNNSFGKGNEKLLTALEKENPDAILIAGDMLTAKEGRDFQVPLKLLKALSRKYLVYYALGNHEYRLKLSPEIYGTMYRDYMGEIEKMDIRVLHNEKAIWKKGNGRINIYGLEISKNFYYRFHPDVMEEEYLEDLLGKKKQEQFSILLAHNPSYFPVYSKWGADLVLSGHNHGGVIRIPGIGGMLSPNYRFFPKYDAGRFEERNSTMILSAGLGSHTIPFRVFNPPELIILELKKKKRE